MLDITVIGAGVCGLALAHSLHARRRDWAVFEARPRLGGRVLTAAARVPLDLGPTWFWPSTQPQISRLVADLGLATVEQADDGLLLWHNDPSAPPRTVPLSIAADGSLYPNPDANQRQPGLLHGGARRLAGGMAALVQALAAPLPRQRLHLGWVLEAVSDQGSHLRLTLRQGDAQQQIDTRQLVLCLPPRLVAGLRFDPVLDPALLAALHATPTWMATAAKAAWAYGHAAHAPHAGHSGNAWVTHPQAVLAEVFDSSPPSGGAGLAGFVALGAQARQEFGDTGMRLLLDSQIAQLFGPSAPEGELHRHDWATEAYTCAAADRAEDGQVRHPQPADPLLQQPHWHGRLWLGGAETARQHNGYLEGALSAAARLRQALTTTA